MTPIQLMRGLVFIVVVGLQLTGARASERQWQVEFVHTNDVPTGLEKSRQRAPSDGLPDGLIAKGPPAAAIAAAWYTEPTRRYGHGILGDAIEAGGLAVRLGDGNVVRMSLPDSQVFEDRYPRIVDLDGDGVLEIVTIRASLSAGAGVAIYGLDKGRLQERAATPYIGRANRWLNIAGIGDFLGNGHKQIAYVQTPHIGGTLFFYAFEGGRLKRVGGLYGFSNHEIGAREMDLAAVFDIDGDRQMEIAVPSPSRGALRFVKLTTAGKAVGFGAVKLPSPAAKMIGVTTLEKLVSLWLRLDDGRTVKVYAR